MFAYDLERIESAYKRLLKVRYKRGYLRPFMSSNEDDYSDSAVDNGRYMDYRITLETTEKERSNRDG